MSFPIQANLMSNIVRMIRTMFGIGTATIRKCLFWYWKWKLSLTSQLKFQTEEDDFEIKWKYYRNLLIF